MTLHPGNLGRIYINHQLIGPISRSVPSVDKMWVAELDGLTHIKVEWFDNVTGQDLQLAWERLPENPGPSEVQFDVYLLTRAATCIVGEPGNDVKVYNADGSVAASFTLLPDKSLPRSIKPSRMAQGEYPEEICLTLDLTPQEQEEIKAEIDTFARNIEAWTDGAIVPKIRIISIEGEIALQSFGTGWTIGPKNIKELASPYLDRNTDFIFLTHGIGDHEKNLYLGIPYCGIGAYGELAGSGYSWLPKTSFWFDFECATADNYGHEWMHRLDVTLTQLMGLRDVPMSQYPACGAGGLDSFSWFPNPDRVINDVDAPWCGSEPSGNDEVTKHLLGFHYDPTMRHYAFSGLYGNHCRNGLQDFDETGIDEGGSCPINTGDFDPLPQLYLGTFLFRPVDV